MKHDQTRKPSRVHNISKFTSLKNGIGLEAQEIRVHSLLELHFCYHPEYNDFVLNFYSQPLQIKFKQNGSKYTYKYTPDFRLVYANGTEVLVEVKPVARLTKKISERFIVNRQQCLEQLNTELILVTDKDIYQEPLFSNLASIRRYAGLRTLTTVDKEVLHCIYQYKKLTLSEIAHKLSAPLQEVRIACLHWLSSFHIKSDLMSSPINADSYVWVAE